MKNVTATGKIINFAKELFACRLPEWVATLTEGDFLATEREVYQAASRLFDEVMGLCLSASALQVCKSAKTSQKNLVSRSHKIKLRTGHCVEVEGLYRKRPAARDDRSRHLLESHWGVIEGAGPGLYDVAAHAAMVAPSYDQAQCLLVRHGVGMSVSGIRRLTNRVADRCSNLGEANLLLASGESLAGKRVLISSDGGRSRTRDYRTRGDENTPARYDTPWKEPKLFVIEVLDERGRLCTHHLPIYGCRFTDEDHLALLEEYLTRLNIAEAEEVQLVADGATWIWNRVPDLLRRLGVAPHRTTETLDYYHAVEHLHRLFDHLPRRIGKKHRSRLWKRCKQWLWLGKADHVLRLFGWLWKRMPKQARVEINYFTKHQNRTQYADYESSKLVCGSGVIESAIRRVINLRFKNTSTFWGADNLEKLYFLRGAVLSKRWDLLMENLANGR